MNILSQYLKLYPFFCCILLTSAVAQQWQHLGLYGERIETIAIDPKNPNVIYAGSTSDFSAGKTGSLFKTTNGGISWDTLVKNITVGDIDIHPVDSKTVFVVGGVNGLTVSKIIKTTNTGLTWVKSDSGISKSSFSGPYCLEFDPAHPETLYSGSGFSDGGGLYKSTNGGLVWSKIVGPLEFLNGISAIGIDPSNTAHVMAATNGNTYLFASTDGGISWFNRWTNERFIFTVNYLNGNRIYVGTAAPSGSKIGLYFSDDDFITWKNITSDYLSSVQIERIVQRMDTLYVIGNNKLAIVLYDSIYQPINTEGLLCYDIAISNEGLYIGTPNGIYKNDKILSVVGHTEDVSSNILFQNYPNPFNPATNIKLKVSERNYYQLKVFNLIGQELATLFGGELFPGEYSITFNAGVFTNGIYFYRLASKNYQQTKKMIISK